MASFSAVLSYSHCFIAPAVIIWAVITQDKTISAMIQMGSLQRRKQVTEQFSKLSKEEFSKLGNSNSQSHSSGKGIDVKADQVKGINLNEWQTTFSKCVFTLAILNIGLTCYILGANPESFYLLFTFKIVSLTTFRSLAFCKEGKHWLLVDFCYWVNFYFIYYLWVTPGNAKTFQILFMCANGPLAWAMLAFSHSMILHSWQHVTSVVIHASPMLVSFGLRWFTGPESRFRVCQPGQYENDWEAGAYCSVSGWTLVTQAVTNFYLWWLVLYYVIVMFWMAEYLHTRGFQTLFDRVTTKGIMKRFLRPYMVTSPRAKTYHGNFLAKAVYLSIHCVYGVVTMSIIAPFFNNFYFHFFYCMLLAMVTAWNGAGFYFSAFGRDKRGQEIARRCRQNSMSVDASVKQ